MNQRPDVDDDLVAYLDGALDGAAAERVRVRLASDAAYARRAEELKAVDALLAAWSAEAAAPGAA
ncbi:MAG TPA: anti-sigma factor, partial [Planctomycetota bacterium]|nr:anti-sigma factor [Planctomycetota bacterium]